MKRYDVYVAKWPEYADLPYRGTIRAFIIKTEDLRDTPVVKLEVSDQHTEDFMNDLATKICDYMNARETAIAEATKNLQL